MLVDANAKVAGALSRGTLSSYANATLQLAMNLFPEDKPEPGGGGDLLPTCQPALVEVVVSTARLETFPPSL